MKRSILGGKTHHGMSAVLAGLPIYLKDMKTRAVTFLASNAVCRLSYRVPGNESYLKKFGFRKDSLTYEK